MSDTPNTQEPEPELWIRIGESVRSPDGRRLGKVVAAVASPTLARLTHVSVEPLGNLVPPRLVPVSDLRAGEDTLVLTRADAWPEAYEHTYDLEYLPPDQRSRVSLPIPYEPDELLVLGMLDEPEGVGPVLHDHVPEGEEPVMAGTPVRARDGAIGHLAGFLVDPTSDRVSHVLLRHGHLWGRRTVLLPIELVQAVDEGELLVDATRDQLDHYVVR